MEQYILKSALVAEIERKIAAYRKNFDKVDIKIARILTDGKIEILKDILSFIDTLEVKEEIEIPINKEKIKETDNRIERQYKNMMRKLKEANHITEDFSMNN